jgi:hypothetical protein
MTRYQNGGQGPSTTPLVCGRPARMKRCGAPGAWLGHAREIPSRSLGICRSTPESGVGLAVAVAISIQ